jgi:cell division protein FtsQ
MKIFIPTFEFMQRRRTRMLVRASAVLFLAATLVHGILRNGMLDYPGSQWMRIPDKLASLIGLAADDIRIAGLTHHDPELLLQILNLRPGGSLLGFDAGQTRRLLESKDWVAAASVQRKFPNTLEVTVAEREPFAIWQHNSAYFLIDKSGSTMGGLELMGKSQFMLVTGEGANFAAAELVNHLEATPELKSKISAAAFVGGRRWTLYLSNGVKIALPEKGVADALLKVSELDANQNLLSKGIREIDMRIEGQVTVAIFEVEEPKTTGSLDMIGAKPQ